MIPPSNGGDGGRAGAAAWLEPAKLIVPQARTSPSQRVEFCLAFMVVPFLPEFIVAAVVKSPAALDRSRRGVRPFEPSLAPAKPKTELGLQLRSAKNLSKLYKKNAGYG
jgi:hypothetical protein